MLPTTGCPTITVFFDTPTFLGHMLMQQAVLSQGDQALSWIQFFEKKIEFFFGSGTSPEWFSGWYVHV